MYDQATRAKARTVAEARGLSAAATVTGVSLATLKRWAAAEGWRSRHHKGSPAVTPAAGADTADKKQDAARSAHSGSLRDPARELAEDADLARRVFRQQGEAVLEGTGRPQWFRDAAVAWGISQDKRYQYGAPAGGWQRGREFTWAGYFADNQARLERIRQLVEMWEDRARQEGNGDG